MKLYLLSQSEQNGWDTYDSMVVAAGSPAKAKQIHPSEHYYWDKKISSWVWEHTPTQPVRSPEWANNPKNITTTFLGHAKAGTKEGVILASFNAG